MALKYILFFLCSAILFEVDVCAFSLQEQPRQEENSPNENMPSGGRTWTRLQYLGNNDTDNQTQFVQRDEPIRPGDNLFEGYSCQVDENCFNGGHCLNTPYGGHLCNCTESWMGPQCEFSSASMVLELHFRPLVRLSFMNCLNNTGVSENVRAARVFAACSPGDTSCWLREGGSSAIKVFFWCLNTGYRMLLSEGRPSTNVRMDLYADAFRKLTRQHDSRTSVRAPQNSGGPIRARFEDDNGDRVDNSVTTNSLSESTETQTSSSTPDTNNEGSIGSGRIGSFGRPTTTENNSRRNPSRGRNPFTNANSIPSLPNRLSSSNRIRVPQRFGSISSRSRNAQSGTVLAGREYLRSLLQAAEQSGQLTQRAVQQIFGPNKSARKASSSNNPSEDSQTNADYFEGPEVSPDIFDQMP